MHERFRRFVEELHPSFEALVGMRPVSVSSLPSAMPTRGIYLFSEGTRHLYVGRTNNLRRRIRDHVRRSSQHNAATFAFRIARRRTGLERASYLPGDSRAVLERDPVFGPEFVTAKERVRAMDLRFVEEADPTRQALLEIYVATVLETEFNDFENH